MTVYTREPQVKERRLSDLPPLERQLLEAGFVLQKVVVDVYRTAEFIYNVKAGKVYEFEPADRAFALSLPDREALPPAAVIWTEAESTEALVKHLGVG